MRVEIDPARKPMSRAAGKAIGILKRMGVREHWMDTPQFGPFKWYALKKNDGTPFPRPTLLVSWSELKGYYVDEACLAAVLPAKSKEEVLRALRAQGARS